MPQPTWMLVALLRSVPKLGIGQGSERRSHNRTIFWYPEEFEPYCQPICPPVNQLQIEGALGLLCIVSMVLLYGWGIYRLFRTPVHRGRAELAHGSECAVEMSRDGDDVFPSIADDVEHFRPGGCPGCWHRTSSYEGQEVR